MPKKNNGFVRRVDELGRIVVPMEIRRTLDIEVHDYLVINQVDDNIVLSKHQSTCVFCKTDQDLVNYKGKPICVSCQQELRSIDRDTDKE